MRAHAGLRRRTCDKRTEYAWEGLTMVDHATVDELMGKEELIYTNQ